jgi:uncharacterized delta-60 repeat protein
MSAQRKVSGSWSDVVAPYIKVSGTWKVAKSAFVKVGGDWRSWFLQGGILDTKFATNIGTSANDGAGALAVQPDGKILVGGSFTSFNGEGVSRIVRLNLDGTRDTSFSASGFSQTIGEILVQPDGKILVGSFSFGNRLVRLNSNGTDDAAFRANTGTGLSTSTAFSIKLQSDGKIVVGGRFTSFNGFSTNHLLRLNSNGSYDASFTTNVGTGPAAEVRAVEVQPDNKILVGGFFSSFNGVSVGRLVRLNSDGSIDTSFASNIGTGVSGGQPEIHDIKLQPDGKILVGGGFTSFNGSAANRLVRLNSDGTRDTSFTSGLPSSGLALKIVIDKNGRITAGGTFGIIRVESNGTLDSNFTTNFGTLSGSLGWAQSVASQADGKILLSGSFTSVNGVSSNRLARIGGEIALS